MVNRITTKTLDKKTKSLQSKTRSLTKKLNSLSKIISEEVDDIGSMELLTKYYVSPSFWLDSSIKCYITYFTTFFICRLIGRGFKNLSLILGSDPKKTSQDDIDSGKPKYNNVVIWKNS